MIIPFTKLYLTGNEEQFIKESLLSKNISGNNEFTKKCHKFIQSKFNAKKALLTTSCTDAMEMGMLMINLKQGDEVILPSYTFSSTANAVCLRNAKPVFVDVRPDTLNMDENKIEELITEKTKAIIPVHYGGISCEMNKINEIARKHSLVVMEDSAQGVNAKYENKFLGTIGNLGAYSFHESKNYVCGEGGALLMNDEMFIDKSEIIWEKGTDRCKVLRGEKDKYSWAEIGSSFLPSDILSAFLYAQLLDKDKIQELRKNIYQTYLYGLTPLEEKGLIQLPFVPENCSPNYHSFFILLKTENHLNKFLQEMRRRKIGAYIGYVPLHTSKMGLYYGYKERDFPVTENIAKRIARLPFYTGMTEAEQTYIIKNIRKVIESLKPNKKPTEERWIRKYLLDLE